MADLPEFVRVNTAAASRSTRSSLADAATPWRTSVLRARQLGRQLKAERLTARCARPRTVDNLLDMRLPVQ